MGILDWLRESGATEEPAVSARCVVCGSEAIWFGKSSLTDRKIREEQTFLAAWMRVSRDRFAYTSQSISCCSECGHVFIHPILDDRTTMELIFEAAGLSRPYTSEDWEPVEFRGEASVWSRAVRIPSLQRSLQPYLERPVRLLDIGAHGGEISLGLKLAEGSRIDLLQQENAFAVGQPKEGVRQFRGLLEDIAGRADQADVLLALHVLEHTADPRRFLADARALMAPDAVLVIEVPYEMPVALAVARDRKFELPHNAFFTPWSLRTLVEGASMEVLDLQLLDTFHTGHGDCAYPVIRAIVRAREAEPVLEEEPHAGLARTIDALFGNLSGSLAYRGGVNFVVAINPLEKRGLVNLFRKAVGFRGVVDSASAKFDGADFAFCLNPGLRARWRRILRGRGIKVH